MEVTINNQLIDKVSEQYKPYIEALRTPTLKSQDKGSCLKFIYSALIKSSALAGKISTDSNADKFISEEYYKIAIQELPNLTFGQIEQAFKKGMLGEFKHAFPKDQYIGVNVSTMWTFTKAYLESTELKMAKKECIDLHELPTSDKPVAGIFELTREQVLSVYSDFLKDGVVPVYGRVYYDGICKLKGVKTLINKSEVRASIKLRARQEYENSLISKKINKKEPDLFRSLMNSFDKNSKTFESISKRLALLEYFKECKENGLEPI